MNDTKVKREIRIGIALVVTLIALGACQSVFDNQTADSAAAPSVRSVNRCGTQRES